MTILKHKTPCAQCPFRRAALPGYLGDSNADEFLGATLLAEHTMPCHNAINYEKKDWHEKQLPRAAHCAGSLIFMKNQCRLPKDFTLARMVDAVECDHENVFSWPQEFRDHHNMTREQFAAWVKQQRSKKA